MSAEVKISFYSLTVESFIKFAAVYIVFIIK